MTVLSLGGNPNWTDYVSCDADPVPESHGLLNGSNSYGSYNSAENIIPNLPQTFSPTSGSCISLVAAMQRNELATSPAGTAATEGEAVDAYCVVTILPSPPANGGSDMIRPNVTGTTKELLTWNDFELSRIPTYSFIDGKTAQEWEYTQKRWAHSIEIFGGLAAETSSGTWEYFSEGGRAFRSHNLIDEYAGGMTRVFNDDVLALFSDENTLAEKNAALAAMLSFGLDIYHARFDYGTALPKAWLSGAGQQTGKLLPTALLASLLVDTTKADVLRRVAIDDYAEDPALFAPQELRQIKRGVTGVVLWGDGHPFIRSGNTLNQQDRRYWSNFREAARYDTAINGPGPLKKKTIADPYGYIDGPAEEPGIQYMQVTFGPFRSLAAAMILMPEIRSVINTDAPIEYVDRVVRHGIWAAPDPIAAVSTSDQLNDCDPWRDENCTDYQGTWGPDPSDVRFALEGGNGRFTSKHGDPVSSLNESSRAEDEWSNIIALYNGNTYETYDVSLGVVVAPEILFETGSNPRAHLFMPTPDAEIRYTLDGSNPTTTSALYTGPITVSQGTEVRAIGYKTSMTPSQTSSKTYNFGSSSGDTIAPSTPDNLLASTVTDISVNLDWNPSTDNIGVAGYYIYINGFNSASTPSNSITVPTLSPNTNYTFAVTAYDAALNESLASDSVTITTASGGTAWSVSIEAQGDDQEIWDTGGGKWSGQSNIRVGGSGSGVDSAGVFPFELPNLGSAEVITGADFSIYLESISGSPSGDVDLYGLDYRSSSAVNSSGDFYEGSYGSDSSATALDNAFATSSSPSSTVLTVDSVGSSALVDFLNAQYAAGAQGGDYIFLRLNPSDTDVANYHYWLFSSTDTGSASNRPTLSIDVGTVPASRYVDVEGESNDREIWDIGGGKWVGQSDLRIGGSGSGVDSAGIFPFELPVLQPGESITGASLKVNLESISGSPSGVIDLYGIDYRATSGVDTNNDFYEGSYGGDFTAEPLEGGFASLSSPAGLLTTDSSGSDNLVTFLNTQYAAGAEGGDYIFLRLNPSVTDVGNYQYWLFSSADSGTPGNRPLLSLEITE